MIVFKNIKWKNLLSTGNQFTEINLHNVDPTLIVGVNGSGKCVRKSTKIEIEFNDEQTQKAFEEYLKNK